MKLGVISLGCDKATVDTEHLVAGLVGHGATVTPALEQADVILVNTCGFIDAAKRESIEAMLEAGRYKKGGRCRAVVAVGCLVARYGQELKRELPEVDYFFGFKDLPELVPRLASAGLLDAAETAHPGMRAYLGATPHVRYLKISEGCDHTCAFCAIPLMRGLHRSRPAEELVREAQELERAGAREINLVAQDLGHYGRDVPGGPRLPELLRALLDGTGVPWYRCLYVYSAGITPALVELMARERRVAPYLDMPIQHATERMLAAMRRPERPDTIREKVRWLREAVPDLALRTTVLVGFPGETEDDHRALLEFLEDLQFDRVGAFAYSEQEGTRGAALPDDVPDGLKQERLAEVLELQRAISAERLQRLAGREVEVLVDGPAHADDPGAAVGRTVWQADDVDGCTYLARQAPPAGSFVRARVVETLDYDLVAEPLA
ncbi:MAG TPA: 30S ribosomal protein S12 methylthiotransferase RimO [Gemmatimonadales bacterium]|nr:30S ribosomal protein S12 methylthiotransferase RimO [Gemmatimonadales bacterium]